MPKLNKGDEVFVNVADQCNDKYITITVSGIVTDIEYDEVYIKITDTIPPGPKYVAGDCVVAWGPDCLRIHRQTV